MGDSARPRRAAQRRRLAVLERCCSPAGGSAAPDGTGIALDSVLLALVLGSGFAALAVLVADGTLSGIDHYAAVHWMPEPSHELASHSASLVGALLPFWGLSSPTALELAATVVTLPAYVLVAVALYAAGLWALARRGSVACAAAWAAAFVAGNVVEVISKAALTRPAVLVGPLHVVAFDASYPSGHALRACLLAALVVRLRPGLWPAAAVWAAGTCVLLVAGGAHTVTDVVGGALLAGFLVALVPVATRRLATP
jgi:membrane-associated phospholipid phosphatase